jgi:hypothetical protein
MTGTMEVWISRSGGTKMTETRIKGPASYFPSIEKTYGRPVSEWQELVRRHLPAKHMQLVAMLKSDHGISHGHANAIVAHTLAMDKG